MGAPRKLSRRDLLWQGGAAALLGLGGYAAFVEPRRVTLDRVTVPIRGLGLAFDGYRIAQISDIHYPRNITAAFMRQVIARVQALQPDMVVVTGDFFDGHKFSPVVADASEVFSGLSAPDGVWGCLGNHDIALDVHGVMRELERTPVRVLLNENVVLEQRGDRLAVAAIDDLMYGTVRPEEAHAGLGDWPTVLLSHNPDYAELADPQWRVDLQLSGHTHGGEVVLPFVGETFVPSRYGSKFRQGLVAGAAHRVYVNRGLCSPRHVRFLCRPEITEITLVPA